MKRGGQVLSKARFVSAQLERYLADDRWLERARSANAHAADLARRLSALPGVELVAPVETNMIFLRLPEPRGGSRCRADHSASTRWDITSASCAGRTRSPRVSKRWYAAFRTRCAVATEPRR